MKKLLLPILIVLMSCNGSVKSDDAVIISDLDIDFPVTDTIQLSHRQTFRILSGIMTCCTKDSIMYVLEYSKENCGHCYDINSGEQISTLINKGKASNEVPGLWNMQIVGDSIQLFDAYAILSTHNPVSVKTFALNDILTKRIGDRDFSNINIPDSVSTGSFLKIDGGAILGSNRVKEKSPYEFRYFIYDNKQVTYFGDIINGLVESNIKLNSDNEYLLHNGFDRIHFAYSNKKYIALNSNFVMLEIINPAKKTIERGKYYSKYLIIDENNRGSISKYRPESIMCTEDNIFCHIKQLLKENGKTIYKNYIFVFDWDLNPVKRYYVASDLKSDKFWLSSDCKSIYRISTDTETQELYEGKIVL